MEGSAHQSTTRPESEFNDNYEPQPEIKVRPPVVDGWLWTLAIRNEKRSESNSQGEVSNKKTPFVYTGMGGCVLCWICNRNCFRICCLKNRQWNVRIWFWRRCDRIVRLRVITTPLGTLPEMSSPMQTRGQDRPPFPLL